MGSHLEEFSKRMIVINASFWICESQHQQAVILIFVFFAMNEDDWKVLSGHIIIMHWVFFEVKWMFFICPTKSETMYQVQHGQKWFTKNVF